MFVVLGTLAYSQPCQPDPSIQTPGYHPDTLPYAYAGQPYDHVIQALVPTETTMVVMGNEVRIYLDSLRIVDVKNMPPSFTYACNPLGCRIAGGERGCVRITGTPTINDTGVHYIWIHVEVCFRMSASDPMQCGWRDSSMQKMVVCEAPGKCPTVTAAPRPASHGWSWQPTPYGLYLTGNYRSYQVYDLAGRPFRQGTGPGPRSVYLPPGMWLLRVETDKGWQSVKWIR